MPELITGVPNFDTTPSDSVSNGKEYEWDIYEDRIPREEVTRLLAEVAAWQSIDKDRQSEFQVAVKAMIESLELENSTGAENTLDLINTNPPIELINTGGRDFFISKQVSVAGRLVCVAYTLDDNGKYAPRLFYKSNSEGEWRSTPEVEIEQDGSVFISKGEVLNGGYVRETRVSDEISEMLSEREYGATSLSREQIMDLYSKFTSKALGDKNTYKEQVSELRLRGIPKAAFRFLPGEGFSTTKDEPIAEEQIKSIEIEDRIKPKFNHIVKTIQSEHRILGKITTEIIKNANDNVEWHFSYDKDGRVWISGITVSNEEITSYGTSMDVILGGVLDNKPLEYRSQIKGLRPGLDYDDIENIKGYVDITKLLDNLPIIQEFRRARGIYRKTAN